MKVGVSSYSFGKYIKASGCNYLDICDKAKEMGFDGIEFVDLKSEIGGKECPLEMAKDIREHCEQIGLEVVAYTIGANFLKDDPQAEVERVKKCADVAKALGAKLMRHDACWNPSDKPRYTYRDAIAEIAPRIREVTEYARTLGIKTCTENHGFFIQDSYRVEELIRAVGSDNYGWLVDMGNFCCADEDSLHAVSVAAPYALHVHAKDFIIKSGREIDPGQGWFKSRGGNYLRGTIVGHGQIPVAQCIAMLKNAGYEGYLSLEFEGMEDCLTALQAGHDYLRRFA